MKNTKRLLSAILAMAMIFALLPAAVLAADTVATVNGTGYATLQAAVDAAAASGGTVTVTADIELEASVEITTGTLTVDLAGKTVQYVGGDAFHVTGGNLTITDSSPEKTGYLYGNGSSIHYTALCVDDGNVTINGGTFGGYMYSIIANGGTVVVNDMIAEEDIRNVGGSITINDGIIGDPNSYSGGQIDASGGSTVINGGTFETEGSSYMFYLNGGTVEVNGGRFTFPANYCICFNTGDSDIVLKGGTYINSLKVSASYASGLDVYLSDLIPSGYYVYDDTGTEVDLGYDTKTLKGYYVIAQTSPGARVYNVTYNLTNLVSSNTSTTLPKGHSLFATFTGISPEYAAPASISIKMNGSYFSTSKYSYSDGNLMIMSSNITGDIVITATAVESWVYTVEGSSAIIGSADNTMTGGGTVYTKTYTNVPVGTGYQLSVKGTSPSSSTQSAAVIFDVTAACDVTVTYDTSSGDITVTGDGVAIQGPKDILLYYDNTTTQWSDVYIYAWNDDGDITASWPGDRMTLVDGESSIYYAQLSGYTGSIIFNNGSGTQTGDIAVSGLTGNMYDHSTGQWSTYDSDMAVCTHESHDLNGNCTSCGRAVGHNYVNGTCACGAVEPENTDRVIYLKNDAGWGTVYGYTWTTANGSTTHYHGAWPGGAMSAVAGESGLYSITVPADAVNIIFHNNSGTQTNDLILSADKNLYNNATNTWSVYAVETPCQHSYSSVVTAPTCTAGGYTTHTCSLCGDTYTDSEIAALGHTAGTPVETTTKEPTCTDPGEKTVTTSCGVCGTVLSSSSDSIPAAGHSYVDGVCTVCGEAEAGQGVTLPTIQPMGAGLAFKDEIYYNVYFSVNNPDNVEITEMGVMTWTSAIDGTIESAEYYCPGTEPYDNDCLKARSQSIAAKNMGEELYMKVYAKLADGTYVYSTLLNYSAKTYAMNKINDDGADEGLKQLCVSLLNYGTAAQQYFGYKTDDLMNAGISAEAQALVSGYADSMIPALTDAGTKDDALAWSGGFSGMRPSVNFGGALGINYIFEPNKSMDGELKLYVWTASELESNDALTLDNAAEVITMTNAGNGAYSARFGGISAKNAGDTVYVCGVYYSDGVECRTGVLTYSVATYCQSYANNASSSFQGMASLAAVYTYYANAYLGG